MFKALQQCYEVEGGDKMLQYVTTFMAVSICMYVRTYVYKKNLFFTDLCHFQIFSNDGLNECQKNIDK